MRRAHGLVYAFVLAACGSAGGGGGGGTGGGAAVVEGAVQKGPFVAGAEVRILDLDERAEPTGGLLVVQTDSDLGAFRFEAARPGPVSVEAKGRYFDEVLGRTSEAELALRAFGEVRDGAAQKLNVNAITHLTYPRIEALIRGGSSFADARNSAESELRAALGIGPSSFVPGISGAEMDLVGDDTDENAYLLTASAVLVNAAAGRAANGPVEASLAILLEALAIDLADDGRIGDLLVEELERAEASLDGVRVVRGLQRRLVELGSSGIVPDIDRILDSDGDDVANAFDNCRLFPNDDQRGIRGLCSIRRGEPIAGTSGVVGDFDEDGRLDFVGVHSEDLREAKSVVFFPGDGAGSFGEGVRTDGDVALGWPAAEAADVDGDGHLDLAYQGHGSTAVTFFGDGQGGFEGPVVWEAGSGGRQGRVYLSDVDGDGRTDLVGSLFEAGTGPGLGAFVARSEGRTFGSPQLVTLPEFGEVTFARPIDLDADGIEDLLVTKAEIVRAGGAPDGAWEGAVATELHLLSGDGAGGFTLTKTIRREGELVGFGDAGDLNGDGHVDLTLPAQRHAGAAGWTTNWLVLFGDGTGRFPDIVDQEIPGDAQVQAILEAPVPGGGSLLASWEYGAGLIRLRRAIGTGLEEVARLPLSFELVDVDGRGDFDGDGNPERLALEGDGVRTLSVNATLPRSR